MSAKSALLTSLSLLLLSSTGLSFDDEALANPIYERHPWPKELFGQEIEIDNTDYLDADHPCSRSQGRVFEVTHKDTLKVSGISVYVYVPDRNEAKFNKGLFKLTLLDGEGEILLGQVSSTYANIIDRGGDLSPTFEVYFPLGLSLFGGRPYAFRVECLTEEPVMFRLAESSRVKEGLILGYYDSTTGETLPYYEGHNPRVSLLFTTFIERGTPRFPPIPKETPESSPSGQTKANLPPPKYHPVVLIHGLGGDPTNFESESENRNYVKLLTSLGYPREYINLYSYGYKVDIKGERHYNYQGDVREIAEGLEAVVNTLSSLHKAEGGDGRVDIVAHSLGNLVTRQYLLTHKDNHKIRRYIAVGAPFKGAWPMGVDKNIRSIPLIGASIEKAIANLALNLYNRDAVGKLTSDSIAAGQVTPGSDFLEGPNGINKTQIGNLEVYTIYGNVATTVKQKIFNRTIETKIDIGDGLILSESATYAAWSSTGSKNFAYNDGMIVDLKFDHQQGALAAEVEVSDPKSIKSLHGDLLTRNDSRGEIFCLLGKEDTSSCY
ncbi:MAG: hypothetical protein M1352_03365 [Patescibacteria group bacterium]|nr:hypothetical protein [Patescibacteria group bacterium]